MDEVSEAQMTRTRIEEALKRAGIKGTNGSSGKRITVENLKAYGQTRELTDDQEPGEGYITHTADVTIPNGESKPQRGAIALVGFHRRVGEAFVNLAIQEANSMRGVKILVILGFEFEGATTRGKQKRGEVTVIKAQANTDLAINDLKDASDDDSFVMLAEPELVLTKAKDGKHQVQVKGVMSYDPEKGVPDRVGCEGIHCWMLDNKYDGKSFFARELHFMNDEDSQLKRLKRDLRSLLDPRAWDRMVGDTSEAFVGEKGQMIAVKVVTTTGVELTAIRELD